MVLPMNLRATIRKNLQGLALHMLCPLSTLVAILWGTVDSEDLLPIRHWYFYCKQELRWPRGSAWYQLGVLRVFNLTAHK